MKQDYDFTRYRNQTNKSLAVLYGVSLATFKRYIQAIQPKLQELRLQILPGSVLGARYWTRPMLILLFNHLGEPE